jgi:hypothetical protein
LYCSSACKQAAYRAREKPILMVLDGDRDRSNPPDEAELVARIAAAGAHDWRACAWLLERRHPERWASPTLRRRSWQPAVRESVDEDDPFREVDELARRRLEHLEKPRPK